jgi:hypothetical protein
MSSEIVHQIVVLEDDVLPSSHAQCWSLEPAPEPAYYHATTSWAFTVRSFCTTRQTLRGRAPAALGANHAFCLHIARPFCEDGQPEHAAKCRDPAFASICAAAFTGVTFDEINEYDQACKTVAPFNVQQQPMG